MTISEVGVNAYTSIGFHTPEDLAALPDAMHGKKIYAHLNTANALGVVLSPLIAIARAIVALVMYITTTRDKKLDHSSEDVKNLKKFYLSQMLYSVPELFFLGPILGIGGAVWTMKRYEMCCFKKA